MSLATLFTIVGGIWLTMNIFVTDKDLIATAAAVEVKIEEVKQQHMYDQALAAQAVKNARIDSIEQEIYNINEEIDDNGLEGRKLEKRKARISSLETKKQNILDGKE